MRISNKNKDYIIGADCSYWDEPHNVSATVVANREVVPYAFLDLRSTV